MSTKKFFLITFCFLFHFAQRGMGMRSLEVERQEKARAIVCAAVQDGGVDAALSDEMKRKLAKYAQLITPITPPHKFDEQIPAMTKDLTQVFYAHLPALWGDANDLQVTKFDVCKARLLAAAQRKDAAHQPVSDNPHYWKTYANCVEKRLAHPSGALEHAMRELVMMACFFAENDAQRAGLLPRENDEDVGVQYGILVECCVPSNPSPSAVCNVFFPYVAKKLDALFNPTT